MRRIHARQTILLLGSLSLASALFFSSCTSTPSITKTTQSDASPNPTTNGTLRSAEHVADQPASSSARVAFADTFVPNPANSVTDFARATVAPTFDTNRVDVTFKWDPSPDASVTGYRIYTGARTRTYTNGWEVGNVTSATIRLTRLVTNYVVVVAHDAAGVESPPSNEVSYYTTLPPTPPPAPLPITNYVLVVVSESASVDGERTPIFVSVLTNPPGAKFVHTHIVVTNSGPRIVRIKPNTLMVTNSGN